MSACIGWNRMEITCSLAVALMDPNDFQWTWKITKTRCMSTWNSFQSEFRDFMPNIMSISHSRNYFYSFWITVLQIRNKITNHYLSFVSFLKWIFCDHGLNGKSWIGLWFQTNKIAFHWNYFLLFGVRATLCTSLFIRLETHCMHQSVMNQHWNEKKISKLHCELWIALAFYASMIIEYIGYSIFDWIRVDNAHFQWSI